MACHGLKRHLNVLCASSGNSATVNIRWAALSKPQTQPHSTRCTPSKSFLTSPIFFFSLRKYNLNDDIAFPLCLRCLLECLCRHCFCGFCFYFCFCFCICFDFSFGSCCPAAWATAIGYFCPESRPRVVAKNRRYSAQAAQASARERHVLGLEPKATRPKSDGSQPAD